jgi:hypothetical protein
MNKNRIATFLLLVTGTVLVWSVQAGELEPPGPPGPTMKDLETVEPRVPLRNDFVNIIPIVISLPGSYYLAEDIFAIHSQHGIEITASNVTLDLNGFTIYGNTEVGSFNGIQINNGLTNVVIKNGTVRDFFWNGISAQPAENIHIVDAWAENAGWISFSCETTSSCATASYGVTIDPVSGEFAGRAWGENVGWISFASDGPDPFRVKTAWTCPPVLGEPLLMLQKLGLDTELSWSGPNGATEHDVVRGDLGVLRSSGGDFSAATLDCTANDDPFGSTLFAPSPAPAQGFWFLARAADCGGGTYDSGGPSQVAPRDAGLDAAVNGCP